MVQPVTALKNDGARTGAEEAATSSSAATEAAKTGAQLSDRRKAVIALDKQDPRRSDLFWPATDKDKLQNRINWERKLLDHRYKGIINALPQLVSILPFNRVEVASNKKITRRQFAELKLAEAQKVLSEMP